VNFISGIWLVKNFIEKNRSGLSLGVVRSIKACLCRFVVFHRFDPVAQALLQRAVQPIKADSLSRIDFSLFLSMRSLL
jgi:hypothetical protein